MNKVEIIGNLGRNPEMSYTPAGLAVTKFSVAASDGKSKDAQGNYVDNTQWFNVTCFAKQAENANEYLSKGKKVFVRGRLKVRQYTTKDNRQGVSVDIEASEIEYLSPKDTGTYQGPTENIDDTLAAIATSDQPF
jgi:single-strand DNA-binding protein